MTSAISAPYRSRSRPRHLAKRRTWLATALLTVVITCCMALLAAAVVIPAIAGWVPLTVLSGSMEPTYPVGSQVIVAPVDGQERSTIPTGTIITFMPNPDDPTLVTHRVVDVSVAASGQTRYTTKGDGNDAVDPQPVFDYQVRAIAKYHIPYLGYLSQLLSGKQKAIAISVIIGALGSYALYQLVMAGRDHHRERQVNDE